MKLLVFILNKTQMLETILEKLELGGITGATILQSKGMAMALENYMGASFLGSLRAVMEPDREENRTILMALSEENVEKAVEIIDGVIDLQEPNTGVLFTVPIDMIKGIKE